MTRTVVLAALAATLLALHAGAAATAQQGPAPQPAKPLTLDGKLTADDVRDRLRKGSFSKVHEVKLEAGQKYVIDLTSRDFDTYLRLEDRDGKTLDENDDVSETDLNSRLLFMPAKTDTYRLVVTTYASGKAGAYRLSVRPLEKGQAADEQRAALERKVVTLNAAGNKHEAQGNPKGALALYEEAVELSRRLYPKERFPDGHPDLALSLNNLGNLLSDLGRREEALRHLEQALAICKKTLPPQHPHLATSLNNLGLLLQELGRREEALSHLEQALAIFKKTLPPQHPDLAQSLNNLGRLLSDLGRLEEALRHHERALAIYKKALPPHHPLLATSLNNLGAVLRDLGRLEEALPHLEQALAIDKKALPPDHPDLARSLNSLGGLLHDLGRREEALRHYEQALAIRKKALPPHHPDLAQSVNHLGGLLSDLGRLEEALRHYEQALAINKKGLPPDHPHLATGLNNLGLLLRDLGRHEEALRHHERALAIFKKALPPDHPDLATGLNNLGAVLSVLGRREEALRHLEQALAIRRKALPPDHPELAYSLNNLGALLHDLGRREEALRHLEQALAIRKKALPPDHPDLARGLNNLGALLWRRGRHTEGWPLLADSLAVSTRYLRRMATASAQRHHAALLGTGLSALHWLCSAALSADSLSADQRQEMLLRLLDARGISTAALASRRDVLLEGADPKARAVADTLLPLQRRLADLLLQGPGKLSPTEYRQECEKLQSRVDDLERQLGLQVQAFALQQQQHNATPQQLAARLPAGAVLVETVRFRAWRWHTDPAKEGSGEPRYAALLLWPGLKGLEIRLVDLGEATPLERAIAQWRAAVQTGKSDAAAGKVLRELLWAPLAKALPAKTTRLIVAPDGALALIPFEALKLDAGMYLIERYAVQYVSTGRDLMPLALPKERSDVALVLADPDYEHAGGVPAGGPGAGSDPRGFRSLRGFAGEADAVAALLAGRGGWRVEQARRAGANEERLASVRRPRLLHCVTHGFFLEDVKREPPKGLFRDLDIAGAGRPRLPNLGEEPRLRSGLALAGANRWQERSAQGLSDGWLTALEVESLDLWGTELVILSACDTGRGEIQVGEGVLGLRRAFQLAGAQTVLASLWKVPDAETEQLMTDTLSRWLKGTPPQEALREAQLAMIRRLRQSDDSARRAAPPLYWAAFISHGRPQ